MLFVADEPSIFFIFVIVSIMSSFLRAFGIMISFALWGVMFCDLVFWRAFIQRKDRNGVR